MLIYLASPYSDPSPDVRQRRYEQVIEFAARAALMGHCVQSPIAHWHPIAVRHDLPTDAEFWKFTNAQLIRRCSELWVLKLSGWEQSVGVGWELGMAAACFIPIRYVEVNSSLDPRIQP